MRDPAFIVRVSIGPSELALCKRFARTAMVGGRSQIREREDRRALLERDQLLGQLGVYAFCKYLRQPMLYRVTRWAADRQPHVGDGGYDLLGLRLDVKTSGLRDHRDPFSYKLVVRPAELHDDWTYVLALASATMEEVVLREDNEVLLMGWATSAMLPGAVDTEGQFAGAHTLPATSLVPMLPMRWEV